MVRENDLLVLRKLALGVSTGPGAALIHVIYKEKCRQNPFVHGHMTDMA